MFRFRFEIAGEVLMDRGIARFSDGLADYRPVWPVIEDDFYSAEATQFKSEGAWGGAGEAWQELSAEYQGWKEQHYPGQPILQRTGALYASLTGEGAGAVKIEERKKLTLGSSVPYGIYHQSTDPRTRLPRRPPVQFPEAFKRKVMAHIQQYLVQWATANGLRDGRQPGAVGGPHWQTAGEFRAMRQRLGSPFAGLGF